LIWGLPKLKNKEERRDNLASINLAFDVPDSEQKLLLKAIDTERVSLGLQPLSDARSVRNGGQDNGN
jgi:hypothetical protein